MTRYAGPGRLHKDMRARQPRWVLDWSNGTRRQRRTLSTDKRTAEQLHLELLRQRDLQRGGLSNGQETLLSDLVATYLADLSTRSSSRQVVNVRAGLDHSLAALPAQRLCDLRPVMVIEYRAQRLAEGLSVRSANLAVDRLRACLNWCVRLDLIVANPIGRTPRLKETEATARYRRRALSESEIVRFLTASEEDDQLCATRRAIGQSYRGSRHTPRIPQTCLWRALIETGARWGELTRCTWADVDFHGRVLVLCASNTKSGKARSIPLLDGLVADLIRLRALHGPMDATGRVFLAPGGVPWGRPTTNPMRIFDRVLERAVIPRVDAQGRKLDIHSLRTTCGSRMARSGVGIVHTQRLLGHSSISLTERHYTDLGLEDIRAAMQGVPATGSERKEVG